MSNESLDDIIGTVFISKAKCDVFSNERMHKEVLAAIKELDLDTPPNITAFRGHPVYTNMRAYAKFHTGKEDPGYVLEQFFEGVTRFAKSLSTQDLYDYIKEQISEEMIHKAYAGEFKGKMIATLFPYDEEIINNPRADEQQRTYHRSLRSVRNQFKSSRRSDFQSGEISLKKAINAVRPDLQKKYGHSLYDAFKKTLITDEKVVKTVRDRYYDGKSVSYQALHAQGLSALVYRIQRMPSFGSIAFTHDQKVSNILGDNKDITIDNTRFGKDKKQDTEEIPIHLAKAEARREGIFAPGVNALIGEREVAFLYEILHKYDPALKSVPASFAEIFPGPIKKISFNGDRKPLTIDGAINKIECDGRLYHADKESLIEVKTVLPETAPTRLEAMMRNYAGLLSWNDTGEFVDQKVAFVLTSHLPDALREDIASTDWKLVDGDLFFSTYEQALNTIEQQDPSFFTKTPVPISKQEYLDMHDLINNYQHLLQQTNHRTLRQWMAGSLYRNLRALQTDRVSYPSDRSIPHSIITPFADYEEAYGDFVHEPLGNAVIVDLETTGFRNTGGIAGHIGVGYYNGTENVVEQLIPQNPLWEASSLNRLIELIDGASPIVTFNGVPFDIPFLDERLFANRIRYSFDQPRVDTYPSYGRDRRNQRKKTASLQTYERVELGFSRSALLGHKDIPGKDIPGVIKQYFMGSDPKKMYEAAEHNVLDIISTAHRYMTKMTF